MGRETNRQRRDKRAATARGKAADARANQARLEQRRRARSILSSVVAVAAIVAVIALVAVNRGTKNDPSGNPKPAAASLVDAVTNVSPTALDGIGQGSAQLNEKPISDSPLGTAGKPELLFIGAEFCPFCAAERWSLIQALSRFGTFSDLDQARSATGDGNLATFSFRKASYTSKYLTFDPIENEDRSEKPLEPVTAAQQAIWSKYTQGFPFLDFNGQYVATTSGYDPNDLSGLDWTQITNDLKDPSSTVAKDILGEANVLTATICKVTDGQPASVCQASALSTITPKLST